MGILELIILILLVMWIIGFAAHIGGGLIHILLVLFLIVLAIRLIRGSTVV